jgi:hypothetical protein
MEEASYQKISVFSTAAIDNFLWDGLYRLIFRDAARRTQALSVLCEDIDLAVALMKPAPPGLSYRELWVLHYVRKLRPLAKVGALPLVPNRSFRVWLYERLEDRAIKELLWLARKSSLAGESSGERENFDARLIDEVRELRLMEFLNQDLGRLIGFIEDPPPKEKPEDIQTANGSFRKWLKKHPRVP